LERYLGDARSGHGRLAVLAGEAGVGKTVLLQRFCGEHAGRIRILWGACDALHTPRPLGPLVDMAAATTGALHVAVAGTAHAHEVFEALFDELRSDAPTIVVFEDVHWADEATLDVLRLLGRRIELV